MRLEDVPDERAAGTWRGLRLSVTDGEPSLRLEHTGQGLLRWTQQGRPLLWARLHGGFEGFSWLRAVEAPRLLPPFTAAQAREAGGSVIRWAHLLAPRLEEAGVLHRGDWELSVALPETPGWSAGERTVVLAGQSVRAVVVRRPERALAAVEGDRFEWDTTGGGWLVGLRAAPDVDSGRVKAWRKAAREGVLPPLVITFVSVLDSWLLLDGHERLLAATLEGVAPTMISVSAIREQASVVDADAQARLHTQLEQWLAGAGVLSASAVAALNTRLQAAFPSASHTLSRTHAWALPGGAAEWTAEVEARLRSVKSLGAGARLVP